MDSMHKVGCMKRVGVIGLGEVYKVGQSVESKHLHQHRVSCRNIPQDRPLNEELSWPDGAGCTSHFVIRALIKTSASFCQTAA